MNLNFSRGSSIYTIKLDLAFIRACGTLEICTVTRLFCGTKRVDISATENVGKTIYKE